MKHLVYLLTVSGTLGTDDCEVNSNRKLYLNEDVITKKNQLKTNTF